MSNWQPLPENCTKVKFEIMFVACVVLKWLWYSVQQIKADVSTPQKYHFAQCSERQRIIIFYGHDHGI